MKDSAKDWLDEELENFRISIQIVLNDATEFRWRSWVIEKNFAARQAQAKQAITDKLREAKVETANQMIQAFLGSKNNMDSAFEKLRAERDNIAKEKT